MSDHLIWWLLGFIPGGIIGGYLIGRVCGREAKKRIDALTQENKELAEKLKAKMEENFQKREDAAFSAEEKLKAIEMAEGLRYKPSAPKYEDYIQEIDLDSGDGDGEGKPVYCWEDDLDEDDAPEIRIITPEDFRQFINTKDSETLTYYQEDGVLVDEMNEVIHGQADILGEELTEKIDDTEEDYFYIDNEAEDKLYEIVVEHNESYYRDVLGAAWVEK